MYTWFSKKEKSFSSTLPSFFSHWQPPLLNSQLTPFEKNPPFWQIVVYYAQYFTDFFLFQFLWTSFLLGLEQFKLLWNLCKRVANTIILWWILTDSSGSWAVFFFQVDVKWLWRILWTVLGFYKVNRTNLGIGREEERDWLIYWLFEFSVIGSCNWSW